MLNTKPIVLGGVGYPSPGPQHPHLCWCIHNAAGTQTPAGVQPVQRAALPYLQDAGQVPGGTF